MLLIKNKFLRQIFGILETINFLALKLLIKKPSNFQLMPGRIFREYMGLVEYEKWPCQNFFSIFPEINQVRVTVEILHGKGVCTPPEELVYLAMITKAISARTIFEIGTYRGRSALNFALNSSSDSHIYTLDLPPDLDPITVNGLSPADAALVKTSQPGADYKGKDVEHKIEQLYGDSTKFDFSPYFEKIDLVYIDGAHHYKAVLSDSRNALKMVRPGGIIIWDDFANYGSYNDVTRAALRSVPAKDLVHISGTQLAMYKVAKK